MTGDVVVGEAHGDRLAIHLDGRGPSARDADERHLLDVGAVRVARLEAHALQLARQVRDGAGLPGRSGAAPLEAIGRQRADVTEEFVRGDRGGGALHARCLGGGRVFTTRAAGSYQECRGEDENVLHGRFNSWRLPAEGSSQGDHEIGEERVPFHLPPQTKCKTSSTP